MAFSPARVVATADLNGGANDFEEFYCAAVEWEWGDDTQVEYCRPTANRTRRARARSSGGSPPITSIERPGDYRIQFRLKQKDKPIAVGEHVGQDPAGPRRTGGGY